MPISPSGAPGSTIRWSCRGAAAACACGWVSRRTSSPVSLPTSPWPMSQLRLAQDLPLLELRSVSGRLAGKRLAHGFEAGAKKLALATRDGINIEPTDFQLSWNEARGDLPAKGEFSANGLDLEALSRLATYLPFDAAARRRLAEAAPRGKLFDLKTSWSGVRGEARRLQPARSLRAPRHARSGGAAGIRRRFRQHRRQRQGRHPEACQQECLGGHCRRYSPIRVSTSNRSMPRRAGRRRKDGIEVKLGQFRLREPGCRRHCLRPILWLGRASRARSI